MTHSTRPRFGIATAPQQVDYADISCGSGGSTKLNEVTTVKMYCYSESVI